jgi:hypothetical protein
MTVPLVRDLADRSIGIDDPTGLARAQIRPVDMVERRHAPVIIEERSGFDQAMMRDIVVQALIRAGVDPAFSGMGGDQSRHRIEIGRNAILPAGQGSSAGDALPGQIREFGFAKPSSDPVRIDRARADERLRSFEMIFQRRAGEGKERLLDDHVANVGDQDVPVALPLGDASLNIIAIGEPARQHDIRMRRELCVERRRPDSPRPQVVPELRVVGPNEQNGFADELTVGNERLDKGSDRFDAIAGRKSHHEIAPWQKTTERHVSTPANPLHRGLTA